MTYDILESIYSLIFFNLGTIGIDACCFGNLVMFIHLDSSSVT